MPVIDLFKLLLDDISDKKDLASAEQVREYERGHGRYEYHGDAADDAWQSQRENDFGEGLEFIGSQILCRLDHIDVYLDEAVINRQQHKWQEVIDHTQDNGVGCIDDLQGRQMENMQDGVDDTVFLQ